MRTLTMGLGLVMVAVLAAGHVDQTRAMVTAQPVQVSTASAAAVTVSIPTSAPAGVEVLLLVR